MEVLEKAFVDHCLNIAFLRESFLSSHFALQFHNH